MRDQPNDDQANDDKCAPNYHAVVPCACLLSIKESSKVTPRQLTQMKVVFERHFNRVADMLQSRMVVSRGSAPSPSYPDRDPDRSKRTRIAQSLEGDVGDDGEDGV